MADSTKLSVGKALEKLRGTDEPKSRMTRLDEKIDDLDKETQRLRAMRRSLGPGKKGDPTKRDLSESAPICVWPDMSALGQKRK